MRLGGTETIKVDVRIIAACNVQLLNLVREGRFREDLYHRLNVIAIPLPPLRERREDVPLLLDHFLRKFSKENDRPLTRFTPAALKLLVDYDWPGNVRELENVVERAVVLSSQELMDVDLLPESVRTKEIIGGIRLHLSEFVPPLPGEPGAREWRRQLQPLAISDHGRNRAPHDLRHARTHGLESDRSGGTFSDSSLHAQSEDQAPGHRRPPPRSRSRGRRRASRFRRREINFFAEVSPESL